MSLTRPLCKFVTSLSITPNTLTPLPLSSSPLQLLLPVLLLPLPVLLTVMWFSVRVSACVRCCDANTDDITVNNDVPASVDSACCAVVAKSISDVIVVSAACCEPASNTPCTHTQTLVEINTASSFNTPSRQPDTHNNNTHHSRVIALVRTQPLSQLAPWLSAHRQSPALLCCPQTSASAVTSTAVSARAAKHNFSTPAYRCHECG